MKTTADSCAARELTLYAINTPAPYFKAILPAVENLKRKVKRGTYDREKAVKLWEHVAEYAARLYASDFATPGEWYTIFNAATRRETAETLAVHYMDEIEG